MPTSYTANRRRQSMDWYAVSLESADSVKVYLWLCEPMYTLYWMRIGSGRLCLRSKSISTLVLSGTFWNLKRRVPSAWGQNLSSWQEQSYLYRRDCRLSGRISLKAMKKSTRAIFHWEVMDEDLISFFSSYLYCRIDDKAWIPRPLEKPFMGLVVMKFCSTTLYLHRRKKLQAQFNIRMYWLSEMVFVVLFN